MMRNPVVSPEGEPSSLAPILVAMLAGGFAYSQSYYVLGPAGTLLAALFTTCIVLWLCARAYDRHYLPDLTRAQLLGKQPMSQKRRKNDMHFKQGKVLSTLASIGLIAGIAASSIGFVSGLALGAVAVALLVSWTIIYGGLGKPTLQADEEVGCVPASKTEEQWHELSLEERQLLTVLAATMHLSRCPSDATYYYSESAIALLVAKDWLLIDSLNEQNAPRISFKNHNDYRLVLSCQTPPISKCATGRFFKPS